MLLSGQTKHFSENIKKLTLPKLESKSDKYVGTYIMSYSNLSAQL